MLDVILNENKSPFCFVDYTMRHVVKLHNNIGWIVNEFWIQCYFWLILYFWPFHQFGHLVACRNKRKLNGISFFFNFYFRPPDLIANIYWNWNFGSFNFFKEILYKVLQRKYYFSPIKYTAQGLNVDSPNVDSVNVDPWMSIRPNVDRPNVDRPNVDRVNVDSKRLPW